MNWFKKLFRSKDTDATDNDPNETGELITMEESRQLIETLVWIAKKKNTVGTAGDEYAQEYTASLLEERRQNEQDTRNDGTASLQGFREWKYAPRNPSFFHKD